MTEPALASPADADAVPLLKVFSFRSHDEIEQLERATAERPEARSAQRSLAEELTELVHGPEEASRAVAASAALFGDGELARQVSAVARELGATADPTAAQTVLSALHEAEDATFQRWPSGSLK